MFFKVFVVSFFSLFFVEYKKFVSICKIHGKLFCLKVQITKKHKAQINRFFCQIFYNARENHQPSGRLDILRCNRFIRLLKDLESKIIFTFILFKILRCFNLEIIKDTLRFFHRLYCRSYCRMKIRAFNFFYIRMLRPYLQRFQKVIYKKKLKKLKGGCFYKFLCASLNLPYIFRKIRRD